MGKRTVTINLQTANPEKFLTLCEEIIEKNDELSDTSPFADGDIVDMAKYKEKVQKARAARQEALELHARAEAKMEESRVLMGVDVGQTSNTPGTLYYFTNRIKKILMVLNNENPEALSPWGFNVVVRMAKSRGRKKKTPVS